jgi:hypothetical protein
MCIGEVLRLIVPDVDLNDRIITVRDNRFFKTRLVPISPRLPADQPAAACRAGCSYGSRRSPLNAA